MRYFLIILILLFYAFFFIRAYSLSKELGKNIKAKNGFLNVSIIFAGISSAIFLSYLVFPSVAKYLFVFYSSDVLMVIGSVLISIGLFVSTIASLSLKKSWRIGVNESEKTELITSGIYAFSRNPYFLSYDLVLFGMVLCFFSPILITTVFITIGMFHALILKEEKYLENSHGTDYSKYKERTRRYL